MSTKQLLAMMVFGGAVALGSTAALAQQQTQPPKQDQPKRGGRVVKSDDDDKRDGLKKNKDSKKDDSAKDEKKVPVTLNVGSTAPRLSVEKWVKGDAVSELSRGKVYVVEFWATWCGPCVKAIPHMTKLQGEYKGKATIIGVAASERLPRKHKDGDPDNRIDGLEQFVNKQGDKMEYTVAYDQDRSMSRDWMQAAGRNTIPSAFIVGHDGKIAWIGSPADKAFDAELAKAVNASATAGPAVKPSDEAGNSGKPMPTKTP